MKLKVNKSIENNIITVDISVAELGTVNSTEIEEAQVLSDFPRSVLFSNIDFKSNMKIDSATGDPVVTSDPVDSTNVEEVQIENIINKEYAINQDMNIVMTFDVTKIPSSALNNVFDTVEKLGKAYAELFSVKIQEEIGKKLTELRSLNTKFEGETEIVL